MVILDGTVPVNEIERMIDRSYGPVVRGLKKRNDRHLSYAIQKNSSTDSSLSQPYNEPGRPTDLLQRLLNELEGKFATNNVFF